VADCSRLEKWHPGKLGRRTSTAAYGAQPEMVTRPNVDDVEPRRLPSGRGRREVRRRYILETLVNEKGELIAYSL